MTTLATDIVFGVPPVDQAAAAPAPAQPDNSTQLEFEVSPVRRESRTAASSTNNPCPQAGPTDFPDREAPSLIEGAPSAGDYRWKQSGMEKNPTFPFPIPISGFGRRTVKEVGGSGGTLTFRTVEKDPGTTSQTQITRSFSVGATGVALTRIERDNKDGKPPSVFSPINPIPYFPIPIHVGETFDNTGVDPSNPSNPQTLRHIGVVKGRKTIDVCGTVIDSWFVDGEQTQVSGTSAPRVDFNYSVATQFGGLIIFEHLERPCGSTDGEGKCTPAGDLIIDTNLGQVQPSK